MADIEYEIVKDYGVVGMRGTWELHLAEVSWNGRKPKLELRIWDEDMSRPGKGLVISEEEIALLSKLLEEDDED